MDDIGERLKSLRAKLETQEEELSERNKPGFLTRVADNLQIIFFYGSAIAVTIFLVWGVWSLLIVEMINPEIGRLRREQYESRFLGRTPSLDRIECVGGVAYIHTASGGLLSGGQDIYTPVLTGEGKPMTCEEYQARFPRKAAE